MSYLTKSFITGSLGGILAVIGFFILGDEYTPHLFIGVPFVVGLFIGYIVGKGSHVLLGGSLASLTISCLILFITGLEGAVCVLFAIPILLIPIFIGGGLGMLLGKYSPNNVNTMQSFIVAILVLFLLGWSSPSQMTEFEYNVETKVLFESSRSNAWDAIYAADEFLEGNTFFELIGLPVPYKCEVLNNERVCYFNEGLIKQRIISEDPGKSLEVVVLSHTLPKRDWLNYISASYVLSEVSNGIEVTRVTRISSTLAPRWYWKYFEELCVSMVHRFVMNQMKQQAEQGS